nr:putative reverse transcriptase domain-containing protein [Tanacetum cinerariifolium]
MGDEHLDTIPTTKSDEFIKSGVENLITIPSESEGIPEHVCDVPSIDNSPPLNVSKDRFEDLSKSNEEFSLTDNDSFSLDNIDYVEASPLDSELVSSEVMEVRGIKASTDNPIPSHDLIISGTPPNLTPSGESEFFSEVDAFLAVEDEFTSSQCPKSDLNPEGDMLLFEEFLIDDHSSDVQTKSSSTSLNSLLEETHTFDNSLPEFTTLSKVPCVAKCESDSSDDQSDFDEDVLEKIVSLFDEFAGELTLLKSIPPGIDATDCHPEEEIRLTKRLLYENSSPRPPKEFVSDNSDAKSKSFSPSPILIKDSDSHMEEIDLSLNPVKPNSRDFAKDVLPVCYDDDDDEERSDSLDDNIISGLSLFSAITPDEPVLSTEEPDNSLSTRDKHLDTIPATELDEFIKSGVENLIPIPSESEGIPEHVCDVPSHDNSPPLDVSNDQIKDFFESNEKFSSIDDDSFSIDDIDYVEASHPDSELVSSEVMEIVIPEVGGIDDDILLTINHDDLHEKLRNVNLLISKIEALNANPTPSPDCKTKSSSTSLNSLLEETNTFDNSLPEFETFCFDVEEISSGSLTTHSDSLLYASFMFDPSINPFPPAGRSDSYDFTDELIPFISAPEYDCFRFTYVVEDISPTKEPQVLTVFPTHPSLQLNLKFQPSSESLFAYVNEEEHEEHLKEILEFLKKEELYAKFSKCEFWIPKVQFLGHVIDNQGIHVDPAKIESVKDWASPKSPTEIRQFLGLAGYYRRFIEGSSKVGRPVTKLTQRKANVVDDALRIKEQGPPLRVRALVMTISLDLPRQILNAQTKSRKPENIKKENVGGMLVENSRDSEKVKTPCGWNPMPQWQEWLKKIKKMTKSEQNGTKTGSAAKSGKV